MVQTRHTGRGTAPSASVRAFADISQCNRHVRFTPKADIEWLGCDVRQRSKTASLFDHLVGE